jgi:hypothetical protein
MMLVLTDWLKRAGCTVFTGERGMMAVVLDVQGCTLGELAGASTSYVYDQPQTYRPRFRVRTDAPPFIDLDRLYFKYLNPPKPKPPVKPKYAAGWARI